MGGFGDAIKYLYSQFILRDVLSFITPGATVFLTGFLLFFPEPCLTQRLETIFKYSASMHWLLFIPLFGLFFVVGFAVQCLGRLFGFIRIHKLDTSCFQQRLKIFCGKLAEKSDIYKEPRENAVGFLNITVRTESARQFHERSVVLKQMCANNFLAFIIAGVFLGINTCQNQCVNLGVVSFISFLLLLSLFWGYRDSEIAVYTIEGSVKSLNDVRRLERDN